MRISTATLELSLTEETYRRLVAFNAARNGSLHNQADAALRAGIERLVDEAPPSFKERYESNLAKGGGDG